MGIMKTLISTRPITPRHKSMLRRLYKMKKSTTAMNFLKAVTRAMTIKTTQHTYYVLPD